MLFLVSSGFSWDWATHQHAAREICEYLDCGKCLDDMLNGSIAPDRDFKDAVNHHCYSPLWGCPSGDWTCPDRFDCPALEKSAYWLSKSEEDSGCEKYYDIGVASHYYLDSKVFWHRVMNEDYENCHAKFETLVGDSIGSDFNISVCGVSVSSAEFESYVDEFKQQLSPGKDYTLLAVIVVGIVLVVALRFRK